ncbi:MULTISPECIES: diaminopimelate decarboxylase [unclassified Paraburkholderia]|uniref:diaminopimelate decarboxylase n=1 Tax=unclassified Paraburkholderia TaxID=2615204 RepID=UPI00161244E8|nr:MULTISPECIES: diaminopimelate decarboxylase [unclassified Paraburkholderia]MBB5448366.1 diaminopimelate decarboxylase [Paraburkholderia sp. WSM4177]MBB5488747.1 diaminopimelate decarboxylase [Paraburkholderia sp. WSM4180]
MSAFSTQLLKSLAAEFDTPYWVYDAAAIRRRVEQLKVFDTVRYAQKANPNIHILKLLKDLGVLVDAVSLGEIERAHRAGFRNVDGLAQIVYTSDVLDEATIARVIELDIPVNAGSPQMLEQIGTANPGHRVWLRINPGFGHGHSRKTNTGGESSKHGNWHEYLDQCYRLIEIHQLHLVGLHMHIGSGVDYQHLQRVCSAMIEQVRRCPFDIQAISAGGGLPVAYKDTDPQIDVSEYYRLWDGARRQIEGHLGHPVTLEIEPGRIVVAESGCLVTEVRAHKEVGANHFVLVNSGFNDLMRPAFYGSYHRISAIGNHADLSTATLRPTVVAGALCEAGDVFTQQATAEIEQRLLPEVDVNDMLVFHDCGAYGASMSSNYNSRPLLPELLVDDGSVKLIRRRQTLEDLLQLEI